MSGDAYFNNRKIISNAVIIWYPKGIDLIIEKPLITENLDYQMLHMNVWI